jgi:hypothetical protein
MIDASKYADLVLLMVDGAFGFEMETFEFLNLLQVQGFPKVMGVLTHLDSFKDVEKLKKTKKALKHRFWAEIYQGESPRPPPRLHQIRVSDVLLISAPGAGRELSCWASESQKWS